MPLSHTEMANAFTRYGDELTRYCLKYIEDADDAHDVISEVWEQVVRHAPRYTPPSEGTVRSWLYAILKSRIADFHRRKRRWRMYVETYQPATPATVDREALLDVYNAMQQLSPRWQQVIRYRFIEDKSLIETGEAMGINERVTRAVQHRALDRLRAILQ